LIHFYKRVTYTMSATRKLAESIYEEAILLFPNHSVPSPEEESAADDENAVRYLTRMKNFFCASSSRSALLARQTTRGICSTMLYQLVSLVLDDVKMSNLKFNNCRIYTSDVLAIISLMNKPQGHYIQMFESMSRAKGRLLARKRNISNNPDQSDVVLRMNFKNTLNDIETSLASLKEIMLMTTLRQHCDFPNTAKFRDPVPSLDEVSITESEESLSDTSLDLIDNNNVGDNDKDSQESKNISTVSKPSMTH